MRWLFKCWHHGYGRNERTDVDLSGSDIFVVQFNESISEDSGLDVRLGVSDGNLVIGIYCDGIEIVPETEMPIPRSKDELFRHWGAMVERQLKEVE